VKTIIIMISSLILILAILKLIFTKVSSDLNPKPSSDKSEEINYSESKSYEACDSCDDCGPCCMGMGH